MNPSEIVEVLERRGAVMHGHFLLSSGRHSDLFVQKFRVLEDPRLAQSLGEAIASSFDNDFDVVVAPAVGAVVLGFTTALAADARFIFAEREDGKMALRRGFEIAPHERALVVEDVITTGGSAAEVVRLATEHAGRVVGVGALIDRGDPSRPADLGAPLKALVRLEVSSWPADGCPLCERGDDLDDPGSRRLRSL
ncbi:MAG TPA: orotate phosphoribosyltransferase [Actinomycetota bacterium]|nr:orotate phosphoribosyltransferase [Actinomycetota bacterium]